MNVKPRILRWIGRISRLSLSRAMGWAYVKVTAAADDSRTRPGGANRARAHRLGRTLDSRRLHLRAARDLLRAGRRRPRDTVDASGGDRRVGPRLLGADSVHAPDVVDHHPRPRARHVAAD